MVLPAVPADPEPTESDLKSLIAQVAAGPAEMRWLLARVRWRSERRRIDPDAFHIAFATDVEGYEAYLLSAEWKAIRRRVLKAANRECACCPARATQVHHRDYRPRVLRGEDDSMLVALCEGCHDAIHIGSDGKRRSSWNESEAELHRMVAAKASAHT